MSASFNQRESSLNADKKLSNIIQVDVQKIIPNKDQPRKNFIQESLNELAESISNFGVLQPLLVSPTDSGEYMIIAGERRYRAAKLAGLKKVPVIIASYTNKQIAEVAMIENLQREDLHFIEEAEGYQKLMSEFNMTQQEVAKRVGKQQSTIANKLRILRLPQAVRAHLYERKITERHARALLKLEEEQLQLKVVQDILAKDLTVRQTETLIDNILLNKPEVAETDYGDKKKLKIVVKDARIIINTLKKSLAEVKDILAVNIKMQEEVLPEEIVLTIRIPNNASNKAKVSRETKK